MALFGAPVAHENDAERALRAALEMMHAIAVPVSAAEGSASACTSASNRHGGHRGPRSEGREEYSVVGDTVNLAARLAAAAPTGEILVGPTTHRLTALLRLRRAPADVFKGKAEPVVVARLDGVRAGPAGTRDGVSLVWSSPLVGRGGGTATSSSPKETSGSRLASAAS